MRTSPSYTASYRIEVDEKITSIASIVDAVSATGAEIKGLDVADSDRGRITMDLTCDMRDSEHRREVRDAINSLPGVSADSSNRVERAACSASWGAPGRHPRPCDAQGD